MGSSSVRRRSGVVALVLLAGASLAGCGGDNTPSWVGDFCGAGVGVRRALSIENDTIRADLKNPDLGPADVKSSIVHRANDVVDASAVAGGRIRDEEEPDVDQGTEIQAAAVATYATFDDRTKTLQTEANGLDGSSAAKLADGLGPYSQHVADLSRDVAGSLKGLQPFKGYAKLEKESRKPDPETHVDQTCTELQTVAP
jgi:predicted small secreted protein